MNYIHQSVLRLTSELNAFSAGALPVSGAVGKKFNLVKEIGGKQMGSLPSSYIQVVWRNTTPVDAKTDHVGLGFDLDDGSVLRLSLSPETVRHLMETLQPYVHRTQSETSSGIPSLDVSTPFDGENV